MKHILEERLISREINTLLLKRAFALSHVHSLAMPHPFMYTVIYNSVILMPHSEFVVFCLQKHLAWSNVMAG